MPVVMHRTALYDLQFISVVQWYRQVICAVAATDRLGQVVVVSLWLHRPASQRLGWSGSLCHVNAAPLLRQQVVVDVVLLRQRQNTPQKTLRRHIRSGRCTSWLFHVLYFTPMLDVAASLPPTVAAAAI